MKLFACYLCCYLVAFGWKKKTRGGVESGVMLCSFASLWWGHVIARAVIFYLHTHTHVEERAKLLLLLLVVQLVV